MRKYIVPLVERIYDHKKSKLGLETMLPYDTQAIPQDQNPLKPFQTGEELLDRTIQMLSSINKKYGEQFEQMKTGRYFDLESREGKR